jgi:hypothetical protein
MSQIISILLLLLYLLNIGTHGNTSFAPNSDQNSCILVACDNTHVMESKDEVVFVNFFIHPIPLLFATNITCDLSKVIKGILVANVACN